MAKDKDKGSKAKADKPAKSEEKTFKYGVSDLAKIMGVKDASARVQLRNHNVKKAGKSYGWDSKDEVQAVADKMKAPKKDKSKDKKKSED